MNEVRFTVELCEEDRKQLQYVHSVVGGLLDLLNDSGVLDDLRHRADRRSAMAVPMETAVAPETVEIKAVPEASENGEPKTVSMSDVQALVQRLAAPSAGFRDQVKAIVKEYADRVSQIPEEKLGEVMQRLSALSE